jgi:hypothetical protein
VEGFGEALPPRDNHFLVLFAGIAGKEHQKRMILGGLAALQTSLRAVTPEIYRHASSTYQ